MLNKALVLLNAAFATVSKSDFITCDKICTIAGVKPGSFLDLIGLPSSHFSFFTETGNL